MEWIFYLPYVKLNEERNISIQLQILPFAIVNRVQQYWQDRRWNADKPSAALDPYIPTWLTTSPANQTPANFWKSFF